MSPKTRFNLPAVPSLLSQQFLNRLARAGVEKLSASHLEAVERLDAEWRSSTAVRASRIASQVRP